MDTDRQIPGLMPRTRRRANLAPLGTTEPVVEERGTDAEPSEASSALSNPTVDPGIDVNASRQRNRTSETPFEATGDKKVQLGVKVSANLKGRARAAFKEVAYFEDVSTFEQFCSMALEAAIKEVEAKYNDGKELAPREQNLRRGRPAV